MMRPWPWYFMMDLILWGISLALVKWSWSKLSRSWKTTAMVTATLVMGLQTWNEWLSFNVYKAWGFSQAHNTLLGIHFLGAPVEEHLFWYAFAWMVPFLYARLAGGKEAHDGRA